jgi:signal peptidase I
MTNFKPQYRPKLRLPNFFGEILQTVVFVVVVTVLFDMAIPRSLVDGHSMQPTFQDSDRLIVSRIHYFIAPPERGDVIVLNSVNPIDPQDMLIKRVIGLPYDHIEIQDGQVYINGLPIDEPYINEPCTTRCSDAEWQLGKDEYFVMGDNRNHSSDSRVFGVVPINHIVGRVVFRYWPIDTIGLIQHHEYSELEQ